MLFCRHKEVCEMHQGGCTKQNDAWENNIQVREWFPPDSRHSATRKEALEETFLRSLIYTMQTRTNKNVGLISRNGICFVIFSFSWMQIGLQKFSWISVGMVGPWRRDSFLLFIVSACNWWFLIVNPGSVIECKIDQPCPVCFLAALLGDLYHIWNSWGH